jgi:PAS domain S-box-containing protein
MTNNYTQANYLRTFLLARHSRLYDILLSLVLTLSGCLVKVLFFGGYDSSITVLLCFLVLIASGCFGGWRASLFSLLFIMVLAWLHHLYPPYGTTVSGYTVAEIILFITEGILISALFYLLMVFLTSVVRNEERFRRIIDKSAEGLLICDASGTILYSSAATGRMMGYEQDAMKGANLFDFVFKEDRKDFIYRFSGLQLGQVNTSLIAQVRFKKEDEGFIWIECCLNNLLRDDLVRAVVVHLRNITQQVDHQKEQEDFIHMASHELKNPITAIKGYLQLLHLQFKKEGNSSYVKIQGRLEAQVDKLLGLIDDMLDITRIRAGALQYHFEKADFCHCVREAVEAIATTTRSHQLELTLPPESIEIYIDSTRIGQVVTNLVTNAVKYSPDGKKVYITVLLQGEAIICKIKDHGIGIPVDKQKRIFDRFYRVDTLPKGKFDGLGLGLFIASEIVDHHNGKIGLTSNEGDGAEFWFTLPLKPA